jgi:hypothetical protein
MNEARKLLQRHVLPGESQDTIEAMIDRLAELDPDYNLHYTTEDITLNRRATVREVSLGLFEVALESQRGVSGHADRLVINEFAADEAVFTAEQALDAAVSLADEIRAFLA